MDTGVNFEMNIMTRCHANHFETIERDANPNAASHNGFSADYKNVRVFIRILQGGSIPVNVNTACSSELPAMPQVISQMRRILWG